MSTRGRVRVFLASSLDGFIAGPGDDLSWLPSSGVHEEPAPGVVGFAAFMADVGAMLMGRRTYDVVAGFDGAWPYGDTPVLVATHRPLQPAVSAVRAVSGEVGALIAEARYVADGKDVYLDGGRLVQQALAADLVDELIITWVPVLLGAGTPLFGALEGGPRPLAFEALGRYGAGMVQLRARIGRGGS